MTFCLYSCETFFFLNLKDVACCTVSFQLPPSPDLALSFFWFVVSVSIQFPVSWLQKWFDSPRHNIVTTAHTLANIHKAVENHRNAISS